MSHLLLVTRKTSSQYKRRGASGIASVSLPGEIDEDILCKGKGRDISEMGLGIRRAD